MHVAAVSIQPSHQLDKTHSDVTSFRCTAASVRAAKPYGTQMLRKKSKNTNRNFYHNAISQMWLRKSEQISVSHPSIPGIWHQPASEMRDIWVAVIIIIIIVTCAPQTRYGTMRFYSFEMKTFTLLALHYVKWRSAFH